MEVQDVITEIIHDCRQCHVKEGILYGSRAKGTAKERSDIDIAVRGAEDFEKLAGLVEQIPTLYKIDLLNLDDCHNQLLLEDIEKYGRKIC